jgi:hypothetical protein
VTRRCTPASRRSDRHFLAGRAVQGHERPPDDRNRRPQAGRALRTSYAAHDARSRDVDPL